MSTETPPDAERRVEIANMRGLHARASAKFVQCAAAYAAEIEVEKDGMRVDGGSIMGLMLLAAATGDSLTLRAWGADAGAALDALADLIANRFEETD